MLERLRSLSTILERMMVLYERVLDLLSQEKKSLILLDFESLYNEIREKDEILSAIRGLDKDRLRIQDQFALLQEQRPQDVSLRDIAEYLVTLGGDAAQLGTELLSLRSRMSVLIDAVKEKVQQNTYFTEKSVQTLRSIAEDVSQYVSSGKKSTTPPPAKTYTGKAKFQEQKTKTGSLLEKRL